MPTRLLNDIARVTTLVDGTTLISGAGAVGKTAGILSTDYDFVQIAVDLASTGTVQVEVANEDVDAKYTAFAAAFTADGNLTIDPMWAYWRLNISANATGVAVSYRFGERRH